MKILIAGCGIVGTALAARFSAEKHSVTVIDIKEKNLNDIQTSLDVLGVCGDASSPDILLEAGVSSVNLFIAVTDSDEENLLACLLARKLGAGNTIARVRSSQNAKTASILSKEMNLSMVINPEMDTAREIFNYLKYKDVVKVETLAKGTTEIITCTVKPGTPVCNIPVRDISKATGTRILICGLKRNNEVFIPDADTVIQAGDILSFAATTQNALQFLKKMKESVDVDACLRSGDLSPVNEWNRTNIWQYGSLYEPSELLDRVLGEKFDPNVYMDYLEEKYKDIYGIS